MTTTTAQITECGICFAEVDTDTTEVIDCTGDEVCTGCAAEHIANGCRTCDAEAARWDD